MSKLQIPRSNRLGVRPSNNLVYSYRENKVSYENYINLFYYFSTPNIV